MEPTSNLPWLNHHLHIYRHGDRNAYIWPPSRHVRSPSNLRIGIALFALGALGATLAPNLVCLLASRVLWGIGCAAPRTISQAMIRDKFEGDDMARVMAIVQTVFFAGPVLAPVVGDLLLRSWRYVATDDAVWSRYSSGDVVVVFSCRRVAPSVKSSRVELCNHSAGNTNCFRKPHHYRLCTYSPVLGRGLLQLSK